MSRRLLAESERSARRRWLLARAGIVLVGAVVVALTVALTVSANPVFLNSYEQLHRDVSALQTSSHAGIPCDKCHTDPRGEVVYRTALAGDFYRGLVSRGPQPAFVQFGKPTNEACLSCHAQDWSDDVAKTGKVPHPAHLRVADEKRPCVECHRWVAHEEDYMQAHKKMPFSTVCASFPCHVGTKSPGECQNCHHVLQEGKGSWLLIHKDTVRAYGPNACLESCHDANQCRLCHTTGKRPVFPATGPQGGTKAVEAEHVKAGWIEGRHGALALEDPTKCALCHVSTGECQDCHAIRPAFHGLQSTWLNRHKDLAKDKRRCLTCHDQSWCDHCHTQFKEMR